MNKYDKNVDRLERVILPAMSIIGFVIMASIILYNCYMSGVGGTCVSGW